MAQFKFGDKVRSKNGKDLGVVFSDEGGQLVSVVFEDCAHVLSYDRGCLIPEAPAAPPAEAIKKAMAAVQDAKAAVQDAIEKATHGDTSTDVANAAWAAANEHWAADKAKIPAPPAEPVFKVGDRVRTKEGVRFLYAGREMQITELNGRKVTCIMSIADETGIPSPYIAKFAPSEIEHMPQDAISPNPLVFSPAPTMCFKLGDVVRLKSGGPVMTVHELHPNTSKGPYAETQWFGEHGQLRADMFRVEVLEHYKNHS